MKDSYQKKGFYHIARRKGFAYLTAFIMLVSAFVTAIPSVMGASIPEPQRMEVTEGTAYNPEPERGSPSINTPFSYPAGSTVVSMPGTQSALEIRQAYKYMFNRIYGNEDVEWAAGSFSVDGSPYSPGSFLSMSSLEGDFNYTTASAPFPITQAFSLKPVNIAVLAATTTDTFGQTITWEEGYFQRIFKTYLWGDYFDTVSESDITSGALNNYDVLIIPSITVGYVTALETALGPVGLNKIATFVNGGGMLYAQGDSCHVAQTASLVPFGTVNTAQRIGAIGNTGTASIAITTSPLAWSWQTNNLYVLDDPLLFCSTPTNIIATYSGGLTNASHWNSPALLHYTPGMGDVVLTNAHPADKGNQYPLFMNAMLMAMAERSDLRGQIQQNYSQNVASDVIHAQELNVSATVTTQFYNFWNVAIPSVTLVEVVSNQFVVNASSVNPSPTLLQVSPTGTTITWVFAAAQGVHTFSYEVLTYENTTKHGYTLVSDCSATHNDPVTSTNVLLMRDSIYIRALLAARLNGDRDIELDNWYPLPEDGVYFDIALPLENKEGTLASNTTITDIVIMKSPFVDANNQTRIPNAYNNTNNGTNNSIWVINEIFFYYDEYNQPLYPLPDLVENTTYNYTCVNNNTVFTLPAKRLTWNYGSLQRYDYQEPAIRYGIYSYEEHHRTVSCLSYPGIGSVIMNCSGGTVFTNIGVHPVPYHEYLSSGIVYIPEAAGGEVSNVAWKDIWDRDLHFDLRTVFYDIVPFSAGFFGGGGGGGGYGNVTFPPPEEHAVVTTTFELLVDGQREKVFPIHEDAEVHYVTKTWNGYELYNTTGYPYHMDLELNETMIVQPIPRGVGYDLTFTGFEGSANTSLLKIENTSTHTNVYYQQSIAGGHKERVDMWADLKSYPYIHREGDFKINDGARFSYHQIIAGPSRYEVFDSHVQAVFGMGNDVQITKMAAPAFISTYGDQLYHFIKIEDPYEPRTFTEDPYIASYGFGEMAATTYVGGRMQDTLYSSKVNPNETTLCRIEVDNNLGYNLTNCSLVPQPPPGWSVVPDNFTEGIPPLFYDFPFINRTEIWDAWKSVWYFWITAPQTIDRGKVYEIPFQLIVNDTNASYIPLDFEIPPAVVGVKDEFGYVSAVFGRATELDIKDLVPSCVNVSEVRIANSNEVAGLEANLATTVANPVIQNDTAVNASYYGMTPVNFTMNGSIVEVDLPPYAQTIPWLENGEERKTLYIIFKSNMTKTNGGVYTCNFGPYGSYSDHFNKTHNITGNAYSVSCHGPSSSISMSVSSVTSPALSAPTFYLVRSVNNTVLTRIVYRNNGDGIAQDCTVIGKLSPDCYIDSGLLPTGVTYDSGFIYWQLGDVAPGAGGEISITMYTTPPPGPGPNGGIPAPHQLMDFSKSEFTHSFLQKVVETDPTPPLKAGIFAYDLNMVGLQMDHPFAAVGYEMDLHASVEFDWPYSTMVNGIQVNFSVDGSVVDQGIIDSLSPLQIKSADGQYAFPSEDSYTLSAEVVSPDLEEFNETNDQRNLQVDAYMPYTVWTEPDTYAADDTYTTSSVPDATYSTEPTMKVGRDAAKGKMRSYLHFEIPGISDTSLVVGAQLKLYLSSGGGFNVSAYGIYTGWDEDTTSWSNSPFLGLTLEDEITVGTIPAYESWDVTGLVKNWVEGTQSNYGICLMAEDENQYNTADFYSSSHGVEYLRPTLVITYADPWEAPEKPQNFEANDPDGATLRLSWTPSENAFDYKIYRASQITGPYNILGSTFALMSPHGGNGRIDNYFYDELDGGAPSMPADLATTHTTGPGIINISWSDSTVPPSPTYYYRIQSTNHEGNSDLFTSPMISGQVTPEVEAYEIERSTTATAPWTKVGEGQTPWFIDSGLGDNTTFYYRIRARSTEGFLSSYSPPVLGKSNAPPEASNLALTPGPRAATITVLNAQWTYYDYDGDTQDGTTLKWYRNGLHLPIYDGLNPIPASATWDGQTWYFVVTPKDGIGFGPLKTSDPVTINNRPVVSDLEVQPPEPETVDDLVATYLYTDADSDPEGASTVAWFKNNVYQSTFDGQLTIPSSATTKGESWFFRLRPHDGMEFGTLKYSSSVTIANYAPTVTDLLISPVTPKTSDDLGFTYQYNDEDGDTMDSLIIAWYKDGEVQTSLNDTTVPSIETGKLEEWYVTVSAYDGFSYGPLAVSQSVTIGNTEPSVSDLAINDGPVSVAEDLVASYSYSDPDDDEGIGTQIRWYRDDILIEELDDLDSIPSSHTSGGEHWYFTVRPFDGESFGEQRTSPETSINSPPEALDVTISPSVPTTVSDLTVAYSYSDEQQDPEEGTTITWYKNGEPLLEYANTMTVPASVTSKGDVFSVGIVPKDGMDAGEEVTKDVVVANSPPSVTGVAITPIQPMSTDHLEVSYTYHDDDGDPEVSTGIEWYRNDENVDGIETMRM